MNSQSKNLPDQLSSFCNTTAADILSLVLFASAGPESSNLIPVATLVQSLGVIRAFREHCKVKNLQKFACALRNKEKTLEDFKKLSEGKQAKVLEIIFAELDVQTSELHAEALGILLESYLSGEMDDVYFELIAHEIKNMNPVVFDSSCAIVVANSSDIVVSGRAQLLPASFWSNTSEISGSVDIGSGRMFLTAIGLVFYNCVYTKMMAREKK